MAVMLGKKILPLPILQGGMGVGVSLEKLAGAVAAQGGMGIISSALCGYREPDFERDPKGATLRALGKQVKTAKEAAKGAGLVAVNVMVASGHYREAVLTALRAGADAIVCGAGLPRDLPQLAAQVPESDAVLAPVVSSGRAASILCKLWERQGRLPDFLVLEGPQAGGHLGFSAEEAAHPVPLEELLREVLDATAPFRAKYDRDIPVFVAGGVKDGYEMARYMELGAAGAQFATRFITTQECDAGAGFKQALLNARAEDIAIVKSPVGMPGRALRSPLIKRVQNGEKQVAVKCLGCLSKCDRETIPYCISRALLAAVKGDWENGLFFCGANAGDKTALTTVAQEMDQIVTEWRNAP